MKKYLGIFVAVAMLLLVPFTLSVSVYGAVTEDTTIASGVSIGNVDVSGMTQAEAKEAVEEYLLTLGDKKIELLSTDDNKTSISVNDIGLSVSDNSVFAEAAGAGKTGNVVERYKQAKDIEVNGLSFDIPVCVDENKVDQVLKAKCATFNVEATNSTLTRENGEFVYVEGHPGIVIDEEASIDKLVSYLNNEWNFDDTSIELVFTSDEPLGSKDELGLIKDVLGTYTTDYSTSGPNRSGNVANGARLINGSIIYPGETFSVYGAVSPFTETNGYFMAGSYSNGMVVESLGGGICQVSTTLYNAVLRAELDVKQRMNHSMIVTYVDPSADAAISGTEKDFKFTNNTEHPIYIEGYTQDKKITFTIYGVEYRPENREVTYESKVLSRTVPEGERVIANGGKPVGYVSVSSAHVGYEAELWKIVKEDGVEVSREKINESKYTPTPRTAEVGTATSDPNVAAAIQSAVASQSIAACKSVASGGPAPAATGTQPNAAQVQAQQAEQMKREAEAALSQMVQE